MRNLPRFLVVLACRALWFKNRAKYQKKSKKYCIAPMSKLSSAADRVQLWETFTQREADFKCDKTRAVCRNILSKRRVPALHFVCVPCLCVSSLFFMHIHVFQRISTKSGTRHSYPRRTVIEAWLGWGGVEVVFLSCALNGFVHCVHVSRAVLTGKHITLVRRAPGWQGAPDDQQAKH